VLSLGSNQGDRRAWLNAAVDAVRTWPGITLLERSPIYETEPVDVPRDFADHLYLNQIVIVETALSALAFSAAIHEIEYRLGRMRGVVQNMPRTIDIDIIVLGTLRLDSPALTLPHPRARNRRFVLQPLADLRPDLILPDENLTVAERLRFLPESPRVTRFSP